MRAWILVTLGSLFLLTVCCSDNKPPERVIARVGTEELTAERLWADVPSELRKKLTPGQVQEYVQRWIDSEVFAQEARRRGLDKSGDILRELHEVERELLVNKLLEKELAKDTVFTMADIEAYYNDNKNSFTRNEDEARALQILVPSLAEVEGVRRQLLQGEDFSKLAREKSIDPSGENGGEMGYFTRAMVIPEIANAAFRLTPGTVSRPIKSGLGYHLLKLVEIQTKGTVRTLDEVKGEIENQVRAKKQREAYKHFLASLRNEAKIWTDPKALEALAADSTQTYPAGTK